MTKMTVLKYAASTVAMVGLASYASAAGLTPETADVTQLKTDLLAAGVALLGIILSVYSVKVIINLFSN